MNPTNPRNLLLSSLNSSDLGRLSPHLTLVELAVPRRIQVDGADINSVYFPESGLYSLVSQSSRRGVVVGLVGSEGMIGLPVILGGQRAHHDAIVQIAGRAWQIAPSVLLAALEESREMQRIFLRYADSRILQMGGISAANGAEHIDSRIARCLLMAQDRCQDSPLPLTHEAVADMLGVRRPGVTLALKNMQIAGLIDCRRGQISILSRTKMEALVGGPEFPSAGIHRAETAHAPQQA